MNASAVVPLAVLALLVVLAIAVLSVRQAALRRLAVRSALRRRAEAVLVVLGSMLGTAIITGSFIVGDTLDASVRSSAWTQLGPIDETLTAYGAQPYPLLRQVLFPLAGDPDIDGIAYAIQSSGTVASRSGTPGALAKPNVTLLEMDFDDARDFGFDASATGIGTVPTPADGEVVLSQDLADDLGVSAGDPVQLFAYGNEDQYRISAILPRVGLGGYSSGRSSFSFNAFLTPGTIDRMVRTAPSGQQAAPPVALGFVSNRGGVIEGRELTDRVVALIEEQIGGREGFRVDPTKDTLLTQADIVGEQFSAIFLSIGSFAVIAGILLLVNIFVMLAEERKGELGMMRAVGMRRAQLVRAFLIEGSLYAVVASLLGAVVGIGVGAAIVQLSSGLFTQQEAFALELRFSPAFASILGGIAIGLLISAATVLLTSLRISRINVIRAIRDLPEPRRVGVRLRTLVIGGAGMLLGLAWFAASLSAEDPYGAMAAPGLVALGLVPLISRFVPPRPGITLLGLGVVAWGIGAASILPDVFVDTTTNLYVVQGVLITFAAVAVLSQNQALISGGVRALTGARNLAVRLGLAYPLARRFRTGMTLIMYSLVVFTLVFISILSGVFGRQVDTFTEQERGGYDLLVQSSAGNPLPAETLSKERGVELVAPLRYVFGAEFMPPGATDFSGWWISGFDERFIQGGPPDLESWLPDYVDQENVWGAVLADPSLMIVEPTFLQAGGPPAQIVQLGDVVQMRDPLSGVVAERRIVAQVMGGWANSGPFVSAVSLEQVFGPQATPNRAYVAVRQGTDAAALGARLEAGFIPYGVQAATFRSIVEEGEQVTLGFFRLMEGYLALGLLVGVAGLGVIMVRAVRERRRQVGMLRSLGFQPGTVGRAFLVESTFVALEGILIGVLLAVATAYQLVTQSDAFGGFSVTFVVPWVEIAFLSGLTLLASMAATGWPARKASRIKPAVALRIAD